MIAVYARVSTGMQVDEGTSLDGQVELGRQKVSRLGRDPATVRVYREEGFSGEDIERPALNRLRQDVQTGLISLVVCTHPDRLSRDLTDKLIICRELQKQGVELVFVDTECINSPEGELFFNLQSVIAQYELALIKKRTTRGRVRAVATQHKVMPMRSPPYGYDWEAGKLKVNEREAVFVRLAYEWYIYDGLTMREIGEKLRHLGAVPKRGESSHWAVSSVRRLLSSPVYIGKYYYNRRRRQVVRGEKTRTGNKKVTYVWRAPADWVEVPVPAIVAPDLFTRVQGQKERNRKTATGRGAYSYLLKSRLKCGHCGKGWRCTTYSGAIDRDTGRKRRYPCYRCGGKYPANRAVGAGRCPARSLRADLLDAYVWHVVTGFFLGPENLRRYFARQHLPATEAWRHGQAALTGQLGEKEKETERVKFLFQKGLISAVALEAEFKRLQQEMQELRAEIGRFAGRLAVFGDGATGEAAREQVLRLAAAYREGDITIGFGQKRQIVELLIDEIRLECRGEVVSLGFRGAIGQALCSQHQEV
ncbi:MAG: recombinase family protein [Heliobacteriaceae bacterium]|nr:recombinase family protein [Heliobacteriaceae bacterium]MDD4587158.1 recombinase family protein [Heliobacteriaceae bacterium]